MLRARDAHGGPRRAYGLRSSRMASTLSKHCRNGLNTADSFRYFHVARDFSMFCTFFAGMAFPALGGAGAAGAAAAAPGPAAVSFFEAFAVTKKKEKEHSAASAEYTAEDEAEAEEAVAKWRTAVGKATKKLNGHTARADATMKRLVASGKTTPDQARIVFQYAEWAASASMDVTEFISAANTIAQFKLKIAAKGGKLARARARKAKIAYWRRAFESEAIITAMNAEYKASGKVSGESIQAAVAAAAVPRRVLLKLDDDGVDSVADVLARAHIHHHAGEGYRCEVRITVLAALIPHYARGCIFPFSFAVQALVSQPCPCEYACRQMMTTVASHVSLMVPSGVTVTRSRCSESEPIVS